MQEYLPTVTSAIAVEPDRRTFKRLSKYVSTLDSFDVQTYNAALWSELGEGSFASSANRNSTVSATASYEHREDSVPLITIDSIAAEKVDYIKYDVEGAKHFGMDCIGVLYGYGGREELETAGAKYIAETVEDILKFIINVLTVMLMLYIEDIFLLIWMLGTFMIIA